MERYEKLRAMRAEDWPDVARVYSQSIAKGTITFVPQCPSYEAWDAAHLKDCRVVCEINGKVIGFAVLSPTSPRPHFWGVVEVSIYVDEAYLHSGIGTALLMRLCKEADKHGYWTLYSSIFEENTASLALHKKCGFRVIGRREKIAKTIHGKWQSTVIVERRNDIE